MDKYILSIGNTLHIITKPDYMKLVELKRTLTIKFGVFTSFTKVRNT